MATPEQQQKVIQMITQKSPEFGTAPPEFQQAFVAALTGGGSPRDLIQRVDALQKQYPQYIHDEGFWHNPAAIAGLAALTFGVGSAIIPALAGGAAGGGAATGAGVGIGETGAVQGITPALAGSLGADSMAGAGISGGTGILGGVDKILNSKAGQMVGKVAPILGNMAKTGAEANAQRDRLLPSMEGAKLARDKYALEAPGTRMSQSFRASALKSASPTHVNWAGPGSGLRGEVPSFTGGFSGALSNIDPETKALADEVLHKDLRDQLAGRDAQTPYLDQFGHESVGDKVVGGLATGSSIWDALRRKGTPPTV